jgi:hypothetical protein
VIFVSDPSKLEVLLDSSYRLPIGHSVLYMSSLVVPGSVEQKTKIFGDSLASPTMEREPGLCYILGDTGGHSPWVPWEVLHTTSSRVPATHPMALELLVVWRP